MKWLMLGALLCSSASHASEIPLGKFKNTLYYFAYERDYSATPSTSEIKALDGSLLVMVSAPFKKALTMEGTGMLRDGRVLNYAGRIGGEIRFAFTRHPFGRGVGNCPLKPFRSVAVDPTQISLGSKIRIQETEGMKLPDGSIHDGIWDAIDVGGAITGMRVDLFIEDRKYAKIISGAGITYMEALTISHVADADALTINCLNEMPE